MMRAYRVPNEVYARMGPLAAPTIYPMKTKRGEEARARMF
jgi:hypothetical protein